MAEFPHGPVVKNLPSNGGDAGSIPGQGPKIPHAMRQLSPLAPRLQTRTPQERPSTVKKKKKKNPEKKAWVLGTGVSLYYFSLKCIPKLMYYKIERD